MPRRPGRRGQRMANVTVTLPIDLLDRIDKLIDSSKVPSRSAFVRDAAEKHAKALEGK